MNKTIVSVDKSWKYDGFLFVRTNGTEYKRRFRENTRGRFSGKVIFNMWDNVYSFPCVENWKHIDGSQITYEGRYEEIYKGGKTSEQIKTEVEEKDIKIPELDEVLKPEETVVEEVVEENGEIHHEKYATIKACVEADIPVYLVGPAGSGKNHTLEQIAKDLEMDFYFTNSIQQEYKLTGFIDAGGIYHETEFYKAFTNGGLFFLDEMDASIPEVLVLLNAAIANGYFEFPTGKVTCSEEFRVVAAGNTVGDGADEQYTGRLVLDQATLDRFAIIKFDYDLRIEMAISHKNTELVNFVRQLRQQAKDKGIRATFSYRCITMVIKLEKILPMEEVMKIAIVKGFDKDTINTLRPEGYSKYHQALKKVQMGA